MGRGASAVAGLRTVITHHTALLAGVVPALRNPILQMSVRSTPLLSSPCRPQHGGCFPPLAPVALGLRGRTRVVPARRPARMPPARKKRAAPTPAAPSPEEPEPDGPPSKRVGRRVPAAAAAPPPPPVPLLSVQQYVSVVNELLNMDAAAPFAEPLDYAAIGCHDYPKVVKHPMDLGTIKSKLGDGSYQRGEDVLKDVRRLGQLHARCTAHRMRTVYAPYAHRDAACTHQVRRVFDNCYLYNGAVTTGHWVSLQANQARSRRDLAAISPLPRRAARRQATAPPV